MGGGFSLDLGGGFFWGVGIFVGDGGGGGKGEEEAMAPG